MGQLNGAGRPILITGSHRSGTTWVGQTIASAGGMGFVDEPFSVLHRRGVMGAPIDVWFPYIPDDPDGLIGPHVARMLRWSYDWRAELPTLRSARDGARMVRDGARFAGFRRHRGRPLVKDPLALLAAPWLATSFDMQVVVMIRHPAAFASSLKRMGWTHPFSDFERQPRLMEDLLAPYADDVRDFARAEHDVVDQAALIWVMLHDVIARYRREQPGWSFIRHEDLSFDPVTGFQELCSQLGVAYGDRLAAFVDENTAAGNPAEAPAGRAHQLRRNSRDNVSNWRTRLTADEIDRVRRRTAEVADEFYDAADW